MLTILRIYVDSSVYLRVLLGQPGAMTLRADDEACTSAITRTEARRLLFRLRSKDKLDDASLALKLAELDTTLSRTEMIAVDSAILERASGPLESPLGALDAIHLASALRAREQGPVRLITHNIELAIAARAAGLDVVSAT